MHSSIKHLGSNEIQETRKTKGYDQGRKLKPDDEKLIHIKTR